MKRDEVEDEGLRAARKVVITAVKIFEVKRRCVRICRREVDVGMGALQQLAKLKTLFDGGAITQEEFDNLKRKLLQE